MSSKSYIPFVVYAAIGLWETVNFLWSACYRKRIFALAKEKARTEGLQLCVLDDVDATDATRPLSQTASTSTTDVLVITYLPANDTTKIVRHLRENPSVLFIDGVFAMVNDDTFLTLASILGEYNQDCLYSVHSPPWSLITWLGGAKRIILCEPPRNMYVMVRQNPIGALSWPLLFVGALSANFICSV